MAADPTQAASVLLNLVTPPRPPKEPPADAQVLPPPPPGAAAPSLGSAAHEMRRCKPCAFFWKSDGCQSGQACLFCHLCPPDEKKHRKKERRFVASMGNTEIRDLRARRVRPDGQRPQDYGDYAYTQDMQDEVMKPWEESVPGIVAHELQDVEAAIIQKALMEQEVQEAEAEWGWRPYQSPWTAPRVRLQLDTVLPRSSMDPYAYEHGASSSGVQHSLEHDDVDPMSLLPTLLSPSAASPRSDDDKGSAGNGGPCGASSFFSVDPFFNARR